MAETALVDVVIEDDRWDENALAALVEQAARASLAHLGLAPDGFEIACLACDDTRIAALNTEFRGKPTPTNVLSWPTWDLSAENDGDAPDLPEDGDAEDPEALGDIALSFDTCAREAAEQGKTSEAHVMHLIVHSVLHLLGYDHMRDKDAALMEETEVLILAQLGVADPYENGDQMPR